MEPIVLATWGLVAVTALLVVMSARQGADARRESAARAAREEAQLAALREQALALGAAAAAQQAVANEMLEARKAANPLRIDVERDPKAAPGVFKATIRGTFGVATVLHSVAIHVGQGPTVPDEPVVVRDYGNAYLTGEGAQLVQEHFAEGPPFSQSRGDLVIVKLTGRPQDGLEQTREFLYRIKPDWTLDDLAQVNAAEFFFPRR